MKQRKGKYFHSLLLNFQHVLVYVNDIVLYSFTGRDQKVLRNFISLYPAFHKLLLPIVGHNVIFCLAWYCYCVSVNCGVMNMLRKFVMMLHLRENMEGFITTFPFDYYNT